MARLHDQLKQIGYTGHELEVYMERLLFCLFAEDTGIFERTQFTEFVERGTREDGSNLASQLAQLFGILNTPESKRLKNLDETLMRFPYVNGRLFEEQLPFASFDSGMRNTLLYCCAIDWSGISPAIFGSLFQNIMDETPNAWRNLGAHYTTEANILKLIGPLFLDELQVEFEKIKRNTRELRLLELKVLQALYDGGQQVLDVDSIIQVNVDQFSVSKKCRSDGISPTNPLRSQHATEFF
jgi:MmeI, helicase spacer domain